MKLKSLLYGTAAILVSTGATNVALAADLPVAAEPIEYVRVCDAFGKGFFYIPGTDTCLRVSGRVRISSRWRDFTGHDSNTDDTWTTRARVYINLDARNETDFGLLRSYLSMYFTQGDSNRSGASTGDYDYNSPSVTLDEGFISLSTDAGQWTVGATASFFDFFGGYTFSGPGGLDPTTDAILFAYTFNLGNGVSASLGLEDAKFSERKDADGLAVYEGQDLLDFVGNVRVDQGWGSAQLSLALRNIESKVGGEVDDDGVLLPGQCAGCGSEIGWAVSLGAEVAIPGAPVKLAAAVGYAEGMGGYVSNIGGFADAVANAAVGTSLELQEVWAIVVGARLQASPDVRVNLDVAFGENDNFGAGGPGDRDYWAIAGGVEWRGIKGVMIGLNGQYLETDFATGITEDATMIEFRVQRDF